MEYVLCPVPSLEKLLELSSRRYCRSLAYAVSSSPHLPVREAQDVISNFKVIVDFVIY